MRRFLPFIVLIAACSAQADDPQNLCSQAAEHVAACLGRAAPSQTLRCEGETMDLARQALTSSCEQIAVGDAKADGQSGGAGALACFLLTVPLFEHGLQAGDLCCYDYNCEGELVCRKFTCVKKSPLGGVCERENHCEGDLGCNAGKCVNKVAEGGRCDRDAACQNYMVCKDGACREPAADGGACSRDEHCASTHCLGNRCVTPGDVGAVCGGTKGICDYDLTCTNGACAVPPASNKPCDRADFFACDNGETCWESHCVRRHSEGEACGNLFDCDLGLFCRDEVCAP